jgi:hypothetical protein
MTVVISLSVLSLCAIWCLQDSGWAWKEEAVFSVGVAYVVVIYLSGVAQWN